MKKQKLYKILLKKDGLEIKNKEQVHVSSA
jgi:hypothetical protein